MLLRWNRNHAKVVFSRIQRILKLEYWKLGTNAPGKKRWKILPATSETIVSVTIRRSDALRSYMFFLSYVTRRKVQLQFPTTERTDRNIQTIGIVDEIRFFHKFFDFVFKIITKTFSYERRNKLFLNSSPVPGISTAENVDR